MMGIVLGTIKPHINNSVQLRSCAAPPGLVRDAPSLPLSLAGNPILDPAQLSRISGNSWFWGSKKLTFQVFDDSIQDGFWIY